MAMLARSDWCKQGWNQPLRVQTSKRHEDAQMPRFYISKRDGCDVGIFLTSIESSLPPATGTTERKIANHLPLVISQQTTAPFLDKGSVEPSALRQMRFTHATHTHFLETVLGGPDLIGSL